MSQATTRTSTRTRPSDELGLGLIRTSWRLLRAHFWELVAIGALAYVAHNLAMFAAVWVGKWGPVPGLLVFSLVPMAPLLSIVGMLLVLRRSHRSSGGVAAVIAAIGSVLVPFLVVYEGQGDFIEDIGDYFFLGFREDCGDGVGILFSCDEGESSDRLAEPTSPLVLAIVAVALLVRAVGSRVAGKEGLWADHPRLRMVLRVVVGYAEIVWIVLGLTVVRYGLGEMQGWWEQRRLGRALGDWWDGVTLAVPDIGAIGDWLTTAVGTILDAAVTGLVTPLAWLAVGVVIYGMSAAETITQDDIVQSVQRRRWGGLTQRVHPAVIALAWRRIADPEGRFGALLGAIALILRAGFAPVLVFCILYTVVVTAIPYLVWDLARVVMGTIEYLDWAALTGPLEAIAQILGWCLAAPLLAAWADALLARFGAQSQLRLPGQGTSNSR